MQDNLYSGAEARGGIISGIRKCAQAVGGTMGTSGYNAIIQAIEQPGHFATNDGATILESIRFADPLEEMGRKILLEAVKRANKQSGDGSSTTTVLCAAIIEEGLRYIQGYENNSIIKIPKGEDPRNFKPKTVSPLEIKRSLEACIPLIEESINKQKREITVNEVGQVASISAEDEKIGAMIQEIYQQIGKDGIVHWDVSKTFDDNYTIGKGITVDGAGFASPYMADLDEKTGGFQSVARWKNSKILITKQKITSAADFNTLFEALFNKDIKEVVVFCDEYEPNIIGDLIRTRAVRGFKTLLIKMPTLWKDVWYVDLAKATGATVIDSNAGISLKQMKLEHLGTCENIVVDKENTYLDGIKDVSEHIKELEEEGSELSKLRISRLNTATARYFVGAASDSALAYRRLKVEDALHSAYYALRDGVVAGGGVSPRNCAKEMPDTIGGEILMTALQAPFQQIIKNAGMADLVKGEFGASTYTKGYDTSSREFVDMFEAGIVDSASITLNACRNAISVAAAVLSAPIVITLPTKDEVVSV